MKSHLALALISASLLSSCSSVKDGVAKSTSKISTPFKGLAKMNKNDLFNFRLSDLRSNTPPIVKVRPEDLQKMLTGEERYLAYNQEKQLYYIGSADGIEYLPQDFDPNNLPAGTSMGILPPIAPGVSTALDVDNDLGELAPSGAESSSNEENGEETE